jgi:acetoin utilization deacetylase AcuC-like enzyme
MRAFHTHHFELPLPAGHRFPMAKYRLLFERVRDHAEALGITLAEPRAASDEDLTRAHCPDYVRRATTGALSAHEIRRIGFPWSPRMVERSRRSSGASIDALRAALAEGIAVNLAGGTHHASWNAGGGYCVFNDAVVAARHAQAHGLVARVLVVDLDVHHGNGTAAICANDPSIYTFSMHGERNYPALKPPSDLDVPLPDGLGDGPYLALLDRHLPQAIAAARPDAVLYLAGADPYEKDRLGRLALSKAGLAERDRRVIDACRSRGLPLAIAMAGGYAEDVNDIVDIHFATVRLAAEAARA